MSSRCLRIAPGLPDRPSGRSGKPISALAAVFLLTLLGISTQSLAAPERAVPRELRICSDPNNLPFSNRRLEGFENKIAALLGKDLHAQLSYVWWAPRRGFIRNTLNAGRCDVVMGVPAGFEMTLNTAPYYRSTYVFVYRKDHRQPSGSFDDSLLRTAKIGVQLIGDASTPPASALARRGLVGNVVGYTLFSGPAGSNPAQAIVDAVAGGKIDLAVAWGPAAAYFAKRRPTPLAIVPVQPEAEAGVPFAFDIALGVRRGDDTLRQALDQALARRRAEIGRILEIYNVPRVGERFVRASP